MPVLISAPFVEIPVALESGNNLCIVAISSLKKQCHCWKRSSSQVCYKNKFHGNGLRFKFGAPWNKHESDITTPGAILLPWSAEARGQDHAQ